MKRILIVLALIISFVLGVCIYAVGESHSRMEDEYWYTLKTLQALFRVEEGTSAEAVYELNNLLFVHLERYMVARSLTPSFVSQEIDMMMCGNFRYSPEDLSKFKSFITKENLYSYIEEKLAFCPGGSIATI